MYYRYNLVRGKNKFIRTSSIIFIISQKKILQKLIPVGTLPKMNKKV